jgi:hypothetical protein
MCRKGQFTPQSQENIKSDEAPNVFSVAFCED